MQYLHGIFPLTSIRFEAQLCNYKQVKVLAQQVVLHGKVSGAPDTWVQKATVNAP